MRIRSRAVAGLAAGCAALAVSAAPALAAPVTVKTDRGTSCTINASKTLGGGLLGVQPISFSGTVDCTLADPANAPKAGGGMTLTSTAPLGLTSAGGRPTSPEDQETVPGAKAGEFGFVCDVEPGADCDFAGGSTGIPTATYQVLFGVAFTAPEGEIWTEVPDAGCDEVLDGGRTVGCLSSTEKFTTG